MASPFVAVNEASGPAAIAPLVALLSLTATVLALRFAAYSRLEYIKAGVMSKYVPKGGSLQISLHTFTTEALFL